MLNLKYDLLRICDHNDGSFGTQKRRREFFKMVSDQLAEMGYRQLRATQLKGRHVLRLVDRWKSEDIAPRTIENRLSYMRYWAKRVGREHVMFRSNNLYGVKGERISTTSKASDLTEDQLAAITGPYADRIRCSLKLMRYLGLRRDAALRWRPKVAIVRDENGAIVAAHIARGWAKTGRERTIPIRTDLQREIMEESARLCTADGSMIPDDLRIEEYRNKLEYRTRLVGIESKHALRHAYALERYREITGCEPPNRRGPGAPAANRELDREARLLISDELGHRRIQISAAYLGAGNKPGEELPNDAVLFGASTPPAAFSGSTIAKN